MCSFFFSSRRRHTRFDCDWSSDVCSSDLSYFCKAAAQKYDEASRLQINDKFKQYLILKVKEYNKRGEMIETAKGTPQALIESTNRSSFIIRANSNNSKVDQLYKEAEDIGSQADKLQKDNPNIFKS